jgi:DNA-directed RNA polymerase subunit M/transcription elongation factor TFIIS
MSTTEKTYNGWTNYETWAVALWMNNDEGSYLGSRSDAEDAYRDAEATSYSTRREEAAYALAKSMKDAHEEAASESVPASSLWADLLGAALSEVNWHEIAAGKIDEIADDIDAEEKDDEDDDSESDNEDEPPAPMGGGIVCPGCGSNSWKETHRSPIDPADDKFNCEECGRTWKRYD